MRLHIEARSERGKPVAKSGNDFLEMTLTNESRQIEYVIIHQPSGLTVSNGDGEEILNDKN